MLGARSTTLLALCLIVHGCTRGEDPATIDALRSFASGGRAHGGRPAAARAESRQIRDFYEARAFEPAWIVRGRPTPQLVALVNSLGHAESHGLDPQGYGGDALAAALHEAGSRWFGARVARDRVAGLDAAATRAFLRFAAHLRDGRLDSRTVERTWTRSYHDREPLVDALRRALDENTVAETLAAMAPPHPQYAALRQALASLEAEPTARPTRADDAGADTAAWRRERLALNMDRWRWVPRDLGERHVLVNVAAYQMQVVERGRPVLAMRVVVGAPDTPTPLFSDAMTYVVFSPFWNIPESIMRAETLPRAAGDPDYLARTGIEVVRVVGKGVEPVDPAEVDWSADLAEQGYRLRQIPGPENALGQVKFIFPNHFSVYLHDTPADALFHRRARALSHGCVRVEQPVTLAGYVLRDQASWSHERIVSAMRAGEQTVVKLKEPLPVHIGYWTAWAAPDGSVVFLDDPYGIDRRQARAAARRR